MAYKASKSYGARGERRGYANFRIHFDDRELMNALKDIQSEGQDELRMLLNNMMQKAKDETEEFLLDQRLSNGKKARQMAGATPNGDRNAFVRIAESLKISDDPLFIRLFSAPYPSGYLTKGGKSRSGFKLAKAYSKGVGPFDYSDNLPLIIKSSVAWFAKTGFAKGWTRRPRNKKIPPPGKGKYSFPPKVDMRTRKHPGFEQVDFIGVAEDYMDENFEEEAEKFVVDYLKRKGFRE